MWKRLTFSVLLLWVAPLQAAITVSSENRELVFSEQGELLTASVCWPDCNQHQESYTQNETLIAFDGDGTTFSSKRSHDQGVTELHFSGPGQSRIWRIPDQGYSLFLEINGAQQLRMVSGEVFRPGKAAGFGHALERIRYVIFADGEVENVPLTGEWEALANQNNRQSNWIGYRKRFWTLMVHPGEQGFSGELAFGEELQEAALSLDLQSNQTLSFYLGPIEPDLLEAADPELKDMMFAALWFWLRWISMGLYVLLGWIHQFIPVWGLAIMALSLAVKILMWPLNRMADRMQNQVYEIDGRVLEPIAAIKKQYKGETQANKILALYKKEGVHPLYKMKSLAGVAILIPIFIGAFDMLAENIYLADQSFLWIKDLARPDAVAALPFTLPFFGQHLNLLPFLMTGLSVLSSYLHQPVAMTPAMRRQQLRTLSLMAIAFFVLFYTFPAGMVLYWTTNNLISVIKDLWGRRQTRES